ncbi:DNA alkylation repair protein [Breznakiellaceae bacterium SP9]
MTDILTNIRRELTLQADEQTKASAQRFFKHELAQYGVKTPVVDKLASRYFKELKQHRKADIYSLCSALWESGMHEEAIIACNWAYALRSQYEESDFTLFNTWVSCHVSNWASCDTFCNHTMGEYFERFPAKTPELKLWALSNNLWLRRAAAVSLIIPAKRGLFLNEVFAIADILLLDNEDLVQKGYGWLLKAAAVLHETEVFEYVMNHKSSMPRTSLRYAIEKMPLELKQAAMQK